MDKKESLGKGNEYQIEVTAIEDIRRIYGLRQELASTQASIDGTVTDISICMGMGGDISIWIKGRKPIRIKLGDLTNAVLGALAKEKGLDIRPVKGD